MVDEVLQSPESADIADVPQDSENPEEDQWKPGDLVRRILMQQVDWLVGWLVGSASVCAQGPFFGTLRISRKTHKIPIRSKGVSI